ncbi:hypothetical protein A1F94_003534 [Pyrenophora tritici-repentis]|uniref:Atrophin-1 multi-domain protein n=1 Tax=Pyrenophora tritici-repentis TaxID=45151 RepID=A0A2W1GIS0_9PLEO|nr:hypothetical protein PtrV1_04746 [Pyrenophora tritici-repentis]KAF7452447.1 hypothetical protein A1F99_042250 [Pyrenophora tritici-repentis]KAF7574432.1 Atrophin-1 multi-domain protein [Pyrenophora tritici-repentis]KAG9386784.1 hypothetical protein A1F94_003534 [Pyrenophora tritici-repentis]KAI0587721.1 hypothetical protein Alg215_01303 [Pyrenophora tritici-repentis]
MYLTKTVQKTNAILSKLPHQRGHQRPSSATTASTVSSSAQGTYPPPPSPPPSNHRHSSSSTTRRTRHPPLMPPQDDKHDLSNLIDEHIAWTQGTAARPRRGSQGTMIVDWDGTGTPVVTYRNRGGDDDQVKENRTSKPLPAPLNIKPLPDLPLTAHYHSPRFSPTTQTHHAPYVAGYDAQTHLSYDYDGRIVHVHRSSGHEHDKSAARLSAHSDYYAMDLDRYTRGIEVRVKEGDAKKKNGSGVGRFVEKVLDKLEGMGLLDRLRRDRKTVAVASKGKGKARDV